MKNIFQILEKFSIEVPEDKQKEISKAIAEQYKPIAEVQSLNNKIENLTTEKNNLQEKYDTDIAKRDEDLKELTEKLDNAGTDAEKLKSVTAELDTLKETYTKDKKDWEDKISSQQYEFAVKENVNGLKFTSNAAKKAFIQDVTAKGLTLENGKLLGFDDYVAEYAKEDEGVFVKEETEPKETKPKMITAPRSSEGQEGDVADEGEGSEGSEDTPLIW